MFRPFLLLVFLPLVVIAQESTLVFINEIAWMGTPVEGVNTNQHWRYEWLELYNAKDISVKVDGWILELYQGKELYFAIPLSGTITSQGYFLIGASDKIPQVDLNYANLGGKFLNEGMRILLKDNLGNAVDEIDAGSEWPAGDNETKRSMERIQDGWQTSAKEGGTPKARNSEGFREPLLESFVAQNKKDLRGSSGASLDLFNPAGLLALVLALGSAGLLVFLKRRFLTPETFGGLED